jgi:hypothetical protein
MYGSYEPPRSDLDIAVIVPDDYPAEQARKLWQEILRFVSSADTHKCLFKQKIKICPLSAWRKIHYIYWPIAPESYRLVSGAPQPLADPPAAPEYIRVGLLDRLFADVQNLVTLQLSPRVSLRELLSLFYKLLEFSIPHVSSVFGPSRYGLLGEGLLAHKSIYSGAGKLSGKDEEALGDLLRSMVPAYKSVLLDACEEFIPRVIDIQSNRSWNMRASDPGRFFTPVLFKYHRAAYASLSENDFLLKRRLSLQDLPFPFKVKDGAYCDLLRAQMRIAYELEKKLFEYGVPSFSMHLAGLWHTADKALYRNDLRIYWAKRMLGPFLKQSA